MPHYVASDLGLHCLPMTLLRASLQEWVNCKVKSWTFMGHSIHAILCVGLCQMLNCCDIDQFYILYFFAYKTVFFSFQNNLKNLDPSYKMDLDLWDCLGRVKPVSQQNCI